jgi:hypothetical protein
MVKILTEKTAVAEKCNSRKGVDSISPQVLTPVQRAGAYQAPFRLTPHLLTCIFVWFKKKLSFSQ